MPRRTLTRHHAPELPAYRTVLAQIVLPMANCLATCPIIKRVQAMFYLIYISSASRPMTEDDLTALLVQSRRNNARLGITGMLLYQIDSFMQLLEGEETVVQTLFETIRQDERHYAVIPIITGTAAHRNFDDWSMGFCDLGRPGDFQRYERYIRKNLTLRDFQEDTRHAYDFMVMFSETRR